MSAQRARAPEHSCVRRRHEAKDGARKQSMVCVGVANCSCGMGGEGKLSCNTLCAPATRPSSEGIRTLCPAPLHRAATQQGTCQDRRGLWRNLLECEWQRWQPAAARGQHGQFQAVVALGVRVRGWGRRGVARGVPPPLPDEGGAACPAQIQYGHFCIGHCGPIGQGSHAFTRHQQPSPCVQSGSCVHEARKFH